MCLECNPRNWAPSDSLNQIAAPFISSALPFLFTCLLLLLSLLLLFHLWPRKTRLIGPSSHSDQSSQNYYKLSIIISLPRPLLLLLPPWGAAASWVLLFIPPRSSPTVGRRRLMGVVVYFSFLSPTGRRRRLLSVVDHASCFFFLSYYQ